MEEPNRHGIGLGKKKKSDKTNTHKTLETASAITICLPFNERIKGLSDSFSIKRSSEGEF